MSESDRLYGLLSKPFQILKLANWLRIMMNSKKSFKFYLLHSTVPTARKKNADFIQICQTRNRIIVSWHFIDFSTIVTVVDCTEKEINHKISMEFGVESVENLH